LFAYGSTANGDQPFELKGGERILFFGDSITQSGQYVNNFELYLLTRYPKKQFFIINHGISSETLSGLSEPDHDPPRPCALDRFTRDVANWKPDIIFACFGMNDGIYHPFSKERFERFKQGVESLIERVRTETPRARLVLVTPPPFDPYRRQVGDDSAQHFGYKFPAIDYDETLRQYSQWMTTTNFPGVAVVDVNQALTEHLRLRRRNEVSFFLAGDGVHPDETGHWLIAACILEACGVQGEPFALTISPSAANASAGRVFGFQSDDGGIRLDWTTELPMPLSDDCDAASLQLQNFGVRWNSWRVSVSSELVAERPQLLVSSNAAEAPLVLAPTRNELVKGVNLASDREWPPHGIARDVRDCVLRRNKARYDLWRARIQTPDPSDDQELPADDEAETNAIRALVQPQSMHIELSTRKE
jgi:lysophospholipase L1-like esterase